MQEVYEFGWGWDYMSLIDKQDIANCFLQSGGIICTNFHTHCLGFETFLAKLDTEGFESLSRANTYEEQKSLCLAESIPFCRVQNQSSKRRCRLCYNERQKIYRRDKKRQKQVLLLTIVATEAYILGHSPETKVDNIIYTQALHEWTIMAAVRWLEFPYAWNACYLTFVPPCSKVRY